MELAISKWGNSLGVRLPKPLLQSLDAEDGDVLTVETSEWVLKPKLQSRRKKYDLDTLLSEHEPEPYAWDNSAVGQEVL